MQCGGFQFMMILDLWGISFHAMAVVGLAKKHLFKSVLGHCELSYSLKSAWSNFPKQKESMIFKIVRKIAHMI